MAARFVLMELIGSEQNKSIGEEAFQVPPRAGDFIKFTPENEEEQYSFEVIAVDLIGLSLDDQCAGDLILRRVGRSAEYWNAIKKRLATKD